MMGFGGLQKSAWLLAGDFGEGDEEILIFGHFGRICQVWGFGLGVSLQLAQMLLKLW